MYWCFVSNNIDCSEKLVVNNPVLAWLWCMAQLRLNCRSGGADIYLDRDVSTYEVGV